MTASTVLLAAIPNGFLSLLVPPAALVFVVEPPPLVAQPARVSAGSTTPPASATRKIVRRSTWLFRRSIRSLLPRSREARWPRPCWRHVGCRVIPTCCCHVIDCVKDLDAINQ